jgi:hypothetical protein
LRRTSGAVEDDVERSEEEEVVALLFVDAVPVPVAALAPDDVVGGVVRTLVGAVPLEGGEVGGGMPAEDDAAWAKTPGAIRSKRLRKRANRLQRDAIAEDRTPWDEK